MSEFVYLFRTTPEGQQRAMGTPEAAKQSMQRWLEWMRGLETSGHLKNRGQPLAPSGRTIRGKQRLIADGPYVESKDLVAGFIIVEARDLAQATELARECPMLDGDNNTVEIRPVDYGIIDRDRAATQAKA